MEPEKNMEEEKKNDPAVGITDKMIEKAEDFMDEAAEKVYNSEPYQKAGKTMEKATLSLFRKAGKWWGKL